MKERMTRDQMFMRIARVVAERATCEKLQVGAILVRDFRIISTGYNGAPRGLPHCTDAGCDLDDNGVCIRTVHAEANVIAFAAKTGISTEGATLYTTTAPCHICAKLLVNSGIVEVVYNAEFRESRGLGLLNNCGVLVRAYGED